MVLGRWGLHRVVPAGMQGPSEVLGSRFFPDQLSRGSRLAVNLPQLDSGVSGGLFDFSETLTRSGHIPEGSSSLLHCQGLSLCLDFGHLI